MTLQTTEVYLMVVRAGRGGEMKERDMRKRERRKKANEDAAI